jgi:uncharacterized membrane protein
LKRAATILFVLLSLLYPVLVYWGLQRWSYQVFGVVIIAVGVGKFCLSRYHQPSSKIPLLKSDWVVPLVALLCGAAILVFPSVFLVKLYPVCISVLVGSLFAISLTQSESLIERLARLRGEEMTPIAVNYTRKLTGIWALLLYANALVALYLAYFATTQAWTLYCGLLSYLILGGFMAGEILFRQYYIRRHSVPNNKQD